MVAIVDRIESGFLILELGDEYIDLPLELFPSNVKEGDLVKKQGDVYIILEEETKDRKKHIDSLMDSLFDD